MDEEVNAEGRLQPARVSVVKLAIDVQGLVPPPVHTVATSMSYAVPAVNPLNVVDAVVAATVVQVVVPVTLYPNVYPVAPETAVQDTKAEELVTEEEDNPEGTKQVVVVKVEAVE